MNFKWTKWKVIIIVLVFLILDVGISFLVRSNIYCKLNGDCPGVSDFLISQLATLPALGISGLLYIIWSIFQKTSEKQLK